MPRAVVGIAKREHDRRGLRESATPQFVRYLHELRVSLADCVSTSSSAGARTRSAASWPRPAASVSPPPSVPSRAFEGSGFEAFAASGGRRDEYAIGFDPQPDGTFTDTHVDVWGGVVDIRGRVADGALDADVTNPPCEHHWRLERKQRG